MYGQKKGSEDAPLGITSLNGEESVISWLVKSTVKSATPPFGGGGGSGGFFYLWGPLTCCGVSPPHRAPSAGRCCFVFDGGF